ncbi:MAG: HNH endonuclease signature motif containing protein, partial [Actinomycetota bacterium]
AQAMAGDAFLAAVLTDGADVKSVTHMGRNIPARFYTALKQRDPVCVVPGCGNKYDLEIDHNQPVYKKGPTTMGNLARLCHRHHALKTYQGYRLSGNPGAWEWHPPSRR